MGSVEAMQQGSKDRYFQDVEDDIQKLVPEGIARAFQRTLAEVLPNAGRPAIGHGYCGTANISQLKEAAS